VSKQTLILIGLSLGALVVIADPTLGDNVRPDSGNAVRLCPVVDSLDVPVISVAERGTPADVDIGRAREGFAARRSGINDNAPGIPPFFGWTGAL
jgi:hypothetical protein